MAPSPEYERLHDEAQVDELDDDVSVSNSEPRQSTSNFSWLEYSIFLLLGIAMLWAWYVFRLFSSPLHPTSYLTSDLLI